MFRALNEKVYILCWIFASLLLLCVLGYFLVGLIIKRHGISLKLLLIGEEYIFASIGSIVIFLTLLFPVAFYVWGLTFVLMHFVFGSNNRIISYIDRCDRNKISINSRQLNPYLTCERITSWVQDFRHLRRKVCGEISIKNSKSKCGIMPFPIFASGTIGISAAFFAYGCLFENCDSFLARLLENYASLSCVLCVLYVLLYLSTAGNVFHHMYGYKRLFKILFAVFSIIMYVGITMISMNT